MYNYNTMDKVKQFEAHTDYIRHARGSRRQGPRLLAIHARSSAAVLPLMLPRLEPRTLETAVLMLQPC